MKSPVNWHIHDAYQTQGQDQDVITKLVPAVDAATNSLHWLLSPAISWSDTRCLPVVMPYLEIPAPCKSSSTQSIQHFFGLPRDRLLLGSHLNTCFTVSLSDTRRMCPVHFIHILLILLLSFISWIIFVLSQTSSQAICCYCLQCYCYWTREWLRMTTDNPPVSV